MNLGLAGHQLCEFLWSQMCRMELPWLVLLSLQRRWLRFRPQGTQFMIPLAQSLWGICLEWYVILTHSPSQTPLFLSPPMAKAAKIEILTGMPFVTFSVSVARMDCAFRTICHWFHFVNFTKFYTLDCRVLAAFEEHVYNIHTRCFATSSVPSIKFNSIVAKLYAKCRWLYF